MDDTYIAGEITVDPPVSTAARQLHLNALRAAGNTDLAALVQDLRARTYPPEDGEPGARSARHVVHVHGVTVDVHVFADHTVVDLHTDDVPPAHQPGRVNLGESELTDPYADALHQHPAAAGGQVLDWRRPAAGDPFVREEYPELPGDVQVAASTTRRAGYPTADFYVGPDGDGGWTTTLVRRRDGHVDPAGCFSLGRFDREHDAKDAAQPYEGTDPGDADLPAARACRGRHRPRAWPTG